MHRRVNLLDHAFVYNAILNCNDLGTENENNNYSINHLPDVDGSHG